MIHGNHRPNSYRFRNKKVITVENRRFFRTLVYLTPPLRGSRWNFETAVGFKELRYAVMILPDGQV